MNCIIENDEIKISFPWDSETVKKVKAAGMTWNLREKCWESPFDYFIINSLILTMPALVEYLSLYVPIPPKEWRPDEEMKDLIGAGKWEEVITTINRKYNT